MAPDRGDSDRTWPAKSIDAGSRREGSSPNVFGDLAAFDLAAGAPPVVVDFDDVPAGTTLRDEPVRGVTIVAPAAPAVTRAVMATSSPSMDIQVSSNFERLLFEALGRDGTAVRRLMNDLKSGSFSLGTKALSAIRQDFVAGRADERETAQTMRAIYERRGLLVDPHTAVGLTVAGQFAEPGVPMVTLATAHPAKFPAAVLAATGRDAVLPDGLGDLMSRPESYTVIANNRAAVERFIAGHARAFMEKV
jgi:threonine synthase